MSVSTSPKKRKQQENLESTAESSSKRPRKEHDVLKDKKSKKGKFKASPNGEFKLVEASVAVSIPPIFANDAMRGVQEMLDSLIMRYVPALNGVLLCHSNAHFLSSVATIKGECPFANCKVGFDATVWSPQVGMIIFGKINLCSPDHISLLIHQTFNVSIPRHHIQTDSWVFEYGPAENDPEYGHGATQYNESNPESTVQRGIFGVDREGGRWVHKVTGEMLGGVDGILEFTVIELKLANQMLSLVGSLQEDPFSSEHVPLPVTTQNKDDDDEEPRVDRQSIAMESDEDEDGFDALKRIGERASAKEPISNEIIAGQDQTKKKKKRKKDETGEKKVKRKKKVIEDEQ